MVYSILPYSLSQTFTVSLLYSLSLSLSPHLSSIKQNYSTGGLSSSRQIDYISAIITLFTQTYQPNSLAGVEEVFSIHILKAITGNTPHPPSFFILLLRSFTLLQSYIQYILSVNPFITRSEPI